MTVVPATPWPRSDRWLWLAVGLLVPYGLLMVTSASLPSGDAVHLTAEGARQAAYAAIGLALMLGAARLDYRLLERYAGGTYAASVLFLAAVIAIGIAEHGARRWLAVGGITVQPGEFAKIGLVAGLAAYGSTRAARGTTVLAALGILGAPLLLVLAQPDLGTAIVLGGMWLVLCVAWEVRWRLLGALLGAAAACGPLAFVAAPRYQRERLAVFFDPTRDPLGSGFNLRQVEVALGTGGLAGHGLFSGAQSHLDAVAARSSDFMFGFLGAELGLLGGLLLIGLLALLTWRGIEVAAQTADPFGRLLAAGLTSIVAVQGLINVAVNLRMFPATGIPLPFVSQGGSSLVVMMLAVGLLQSVAARGQAPRGAYEAHWS